MAREQAKRDGFWNVSGYELVNFSVALRREGKEGKINFSFYRVTSDAARLEINQFTSLRNLASFD